MMRYNRYWEFLNAVVGGLISLVLAMTIGRNGDAQRPKNSRKRNRIRNRKYALEEMELMSDNHFRRMFRMSREAFHNLEQRLAEKFGDSDFDQAAVNSSGSTICQRTRLACALRWLAGGSYIDICFEFGVSPGSFYADEGVLWGTLEQIDCLLTIGFPFDDHHALRHIADGFAHYSHHVLKNCVLAIDGWVCHTRQPTAFETQFPSSYRNRHNCFGIVVLAGCDADCRFLMFSCKSAGSTNDIVAWDISEMKHLLDSGALPPQFYFIGDEAFQNTSQFLVPWSGRGLNPWRDSFNYHLSAMRQCIERAFALMTQRYGVFWRMLRCDFSRWSLVCSVAAKLHNYCIDMKEGKACDILPRLDQDHVEDDFHFVLDNANLGPEVAGPAKGDTRRNLTDDLCRDGIRRRRHAQHNSKCL